MKTILFAVLALAGIATGPRAATADFITTVSGTNQETGATVCAEAQFSVAGDILTITLLNSTGDTINRGDVLTGLCFNVNFSPSPNLNLISTELTPGSLLFTTKTSSTSTANLNGSWTDELSSNSRFGLGTSGFNGVFMAGTLTQGTGGTDYGIIGAGTTFQKGFSASAFPLVENSLTFQFSGANGITDMMFTDVRFLFGTSGVGVLEASGPIATPAPPGLLMASCALGLMGIYRVWRRMSTLRRPVSASQ